MRLRIWISLLLVVGVARGDSALSSQKANDMEMSKQPQAIAIIGRLKEFGSRNERPSVYIDDHQLARSQNGRYLVARVDPGKHTFRANDPKYSVQMDLKEGECAFFRLELANGLWQESGRLVAITREQGAADLKQLTYIDASHVRDKSVVVDAEQAGAQAATCIAAPAPEAPPPGAR